MFLAESPTTQWIEVNQNALVHNLGVLRAILSPNTQLLGVVKSNAYGHGLEMVAGVVVDHVDWLGVHTADEARSLREIGFDKPILIMGFVPRSELFDLDEGIHLLVASNSAVEWAAEYRTKSGVSLPLHLKVDTGAKRQGVPPDQVVEVLQNAVSRELDTVGVATHFANIEDTLEHEFALRQLKRFQEVLDVAKDTLGYEPPYNHAACSAASLLFRQTDFSLARVGISMYGHWPSRETKLAWALAHGRDGLELRPALSWRALVGQLQTVTSGESVGYGRTWRALRDTVLAVIPVGYADGYPRDLGNRARVAVRGHHAPVVGRICMNILMADVTDIPGVEIGDIVTLVGKDEEASVSVEDLAGLCGTINYEILARLSSTIRRVVVS